MHYLFLEAYCQRPGPCGSSPPVSAVTVSSVPRLSLWKPSQGTTRTFITCRAADTAGLSPACAAHPEDTQGFSISKDAHGDRPLVPGCAAQYASPLVLRCRLISRGPDLKGPVPASRTLMKEKRNSGNRVAGSGIPVSNASVNLCLYR